MSFDEVEMVSIGYERAAQVAKTSASDGSGKTEKVMCRLDR